MDRFVAVQCTVAVQKYHFQVFDRPSFFLIIAPTVSLYMLWNVTAENAIIGYFGSDVSGEMPY